MARTYLRPVLLCGIVAALFAGCAGTQRVESTRPAPWSGLGLTLTLPPGQWEIETVKADSVLSLHEAGSGASLALMRLRPHKDQIASVALMKLFAHIPEKDQIARSTREIPGADEAEYAEYIVTLDGDRRWVKALAVRRGEWMYDLIGWDMDRKTFDAVMHSITFAH